MKKRGRKKMEEIEKQEKDKSTPFLKRVNEVEKKVDGFDDRLSKLESRVNTILSALKTRR